MKKLIVLGAGLLLVLAAILPGEPTMCRAAEETKEKKAKEQDHGRYREVEQYDRNIKLDFKMLPADANDKGVYIITATPEFATEVFYKSADGSIQFKVSGEILPRDDGKFFLLYEVTATFQGGEGEAEFYAYSGVVLKPGKELTVSRMGDRTLNVTASYLEAEKKE